MKIELSHTLVVNLPQRFTVSTFTRDHSPERKAVKVKVNKPTKQKEERKNTGIQVTVVPYKSSSLFKVTHIQALSHEELPSKYLTSNLPKIWQGGNKLFAEPDLVLLEVGCVYRLYYIQGVLQHIRLAGEHLATVNKREDSSWTNYKSATFKDGRLT